MIISMLLRLKFLLIISLIFIAVDEKIAGVRDNEPQASAPKCEHRFVCGKFVSNSDFPFRVKDDPQACGSAYLQFSCEHNRTVAYLGSNSDKYYAVLNHSIIYSYSVRVLDPGVQKNNCSTFPLYSFTGGPYYMKNPELIVFVSCERPVKSPKYIDTAPCLTANQFSNQASSVSIYNYVVFGKAEEMVASDIEDTCTVYKSIRLQFPSLDFNNRTGNISFQDIHDAMAAGYEFYGPTYSSQTVSRVLNNIIKGTARVVTGSILLLIAISIYKCRRGDLSIYDAIEHFLQSHSNMLPTRYSYRQIKKMTNNFKEKLGQGGYGSVYKGKLQSGQFVAIKMLTNSKTNGQDFINEVATLGRIHHVNVVHLVGFCVTATKNALVYDYMPNGSLDKFIFTQCPHDTKLNWSNIHEIAMGVARGLEYLHQGCNMQILHFDIKPHNILLDENFVPKLSDFGLAKLRLVKNNMVTVTAARGTLGYMAPELFYKRVGEISYKADVYSFGMLLMEMAGRRRNLNANANHSSQIYFPSWIYDQFDQGRDVEFDTRFSEEEKEIARKLILIALWCIQMTPNDRPSTKEVLKMLQGESKNLQLPPKPHIYLPDPPVVQEETSRFSFIDEELTESKCESVVLEIENHNK